MPAASLFRAASVGMLLIATAPGARADDCPAPDRSTAILASDPEEAAAAAVARGDEQCLQTYVSTEGAVILRKVRCVASERPTHRAETNPREVCSLTQLLRLVGAREFVDAFNREVMRLSNEGATD